MPYYYAAEGHWFKSRHVGIFFPTMSADGTVVVQAACPSMQNSMDIDERRD